MIVFLIVNKLVLESAITQKKPLIKLYSSLCGLRICIFGLDISHRKLFTQPKKKFQDKTFDLINAKIQFNNQQYFSKSSYTNLNNILVK